MPALTAINTTPHYPRPTCRPWHDVHRVLRRGKLRRVLTSSPANSPFARGCLRSARAENTIVIFPTDNGAEVFTWPDGGMTPFRAAKEIGCQRSPPRQGTRTSPERLLQGVSMGDRPQESSGRLQSARPAAGRRAVQAPRDMGLRWRAAWRSPR
jgi:hypothetical protein